MLASAFECELGTETRPGGGQKTLAQTSSRPKPSLSRSRRGKKKRKPTAIHEREGEN